MAMSPADVLEAAADALFVHGRSTGRACEDDGSMCVRGAIAFALGLPARQGNLGMSAVTKTPANVALEAYLYDHPDVLGRTDREGWSEEGGRVPAWVWNDHQRGPEGDALVDDTLRRCAKEWRADNP